MKIRELFLTESIPTDKFSTREEVVDWCLKLEKLNKLTFQDGVYAVPDIAPFTVTGDKVMFSGSANFKKPLPVQFAKVRSYRAVNSGITDLSTLCVDEVGLLNVSKNPITSFENCPKITNKAVFEKTKISSLKGISQFAKQIEVFGCSELTTIDEHLPKVKFFGAAQCGLITLKDIHKMMPNLQTIQVAFNPIKSNILGILRLPKLKFFLFGREGNDDSDFYKAASIVDKYVLKGDRNIIACQKELYDNDLDEYAEL